MKKELIRHLMCAGMVTALLTETMAMVPQQQLTLEQLTEELNKCKIENISLLQRCYGLSSENSTLTYSNNAQSQQCRTLVSNNIMLTQENGRLRQQNDQLTQENGRLGQQNEQLTKESGILKQQNRDLTQENINQKKFYNELEVSSLKTETNLNNDLAEYIREHLKLQKKYDELEKSNEQLRKKLDNEKKDVQQNEKLLREIDALKDEQQRAQQENERQRREIEELKRKSSQQSGANGGNNDAVLLNVVDWLIAHNSDYSPEPNIDTIYGVLLKKSSVSNITKLFLKQVEDYRMRKIPLEKIIAFLREEENMDALIKDGGSAVYLGLSKIYHPDKKQFANADIHLKSIVTKIMQQANELKDRYKL